MRVIYRTLPNRKISCVATLGVFDGVHTGHRAILAQTKKRAAARRVRACVITFDKLPEEVLHTSSNYRRIFQVPGSLTDMQEKTYLLNAALPRGAVWFLKTTPALLRLSAEEFMTFLFRFLRIKEFIVGEDFRFGYRGKGNLSFLRHIGAHNNFTVRVVKKRKIAGGVVSSSAIRALVTAGDFKKTRTYLGRAYRLSGHVVCGKGLGRRLGFPTANLETGSRLVPGEGVYAAYVRARGKTYVGAVNILRTGPGAQALTEVHIIGFRGRLVHNKIEVIFIDKIRNEKKFPTQARLAAAIRRDVHFISAHYHLPNPDR